MMVINPNLHYPDELDDTFYDTLWSFSRRFRFWGSTPRSLFSHQLFDMSAVPSSKDGRCSRAVVLVERNPVAAEGAVPLACIALHLKMMR